MLTARFVAVKLDKFEFLITPLLKVVSVKVAESKVRFVNVAPSLSTGKELIAHAIHEMSDRADQPFVVFDCAAVAPSLVMRWGFQIQSSGRQ